jgi:uncharacterized OB-fold protein
VPRDACDKCASTAWTWQPSTGRGTLFSWTVVQRALHPSLKDQVPYTVVIIEMAERVRVMSQLIGDTPSVQLRHGLPVEVVYHDAGSGLVLPYFRLREETPLPAERAV